MASGALLRLVAPAEGAESAPLQQVPWPGWKALEQNQALRSGDWWSDGPETDRSRPRPVALAWDSGVLREALGGDPRLRYELRLTAEDSSREGLVLRGVEEEQVEVTNLRIGTTYRWQVAAWPAEASDAAAAVKPLAESAVGHFKTHPAPPRWIEVPGLTNVRDMGGWPLEGGGRVRQGLLFRGSEMNDHCQITGPGHAVMLDRLGIRTDIDLRGATEDRRAVLDPSRVAYTNIPLSSYDMIASPEFTGMYRDLFTMLATASKYPMYIHCWGGADRTGTVAFLLGALLGMREEDILLDYELTSLSVWGERRSDSEPFLELLQTLAMFGSKSSSIQQRVARYLGVIGVTAHEIAAIRDILTERG